MMQGLISVLSVLYISIIMSDEVSHFKGLFFLFFKKTVVDIFFFPWNWAFYTHRSSPPWFVLTNSRLMSLEYLLKILVWGFLLIVFLTWIDSLGGDLVWVWDQKVYKKVVWSLTAADTCFFHNFWCWLKAQESPQECRSEIRLNYQCNYT